jgi:hypothetical protein
MLTAIKLSTSLILLFNQAKTLMGYQLFRIGPIVANSSRGADCPFAHQALRISFRDQEEIKLKTFLLSLRDQIDTCLSLLDTVIEEANEEKDNEN